MSLISGECGPVAQNDADGDSFETDSRKTDSESRSKVQSQRCACGFEEKLLEQFLADHPAWKFASKNHDKAVRQLNGAKGAAGALKVTVLKERAEPRKTHVLVRGEWDKHGDEVGRGVPSIFKQDDAGPVTSRLELGKWIVARDNPLTARVIVNHIWQLFFGAGLVRTPADFGMQGEMPTHPSYWIGWRLTSWSIIGI